MKSSVLRRVGEVILAVLVWHVVAHVIYRNIMLKAEARKTDWSYFNWAIGSVWASHLLALVALVWVALVVLGIQRGIMKLKTQ